MLVFSLHKWIILADENAYGKDGQRFHCIIFCIMIGIIVGVFIFISLLTYKVHFWMACCWCLSMLLHKFMMHVSMDLCINHLISYCVWIIIYYFWIIFILIGNPIGHSSCLYHASMMIKTLHYPPDAQIYNSYIQLELL